MVVLFDSMVEPCHLLRQAFTTNAFTNDAIPKKIRTLNRIQKPFVYIFLLNAAQTDKLDLTIRGNCINDQDSIPIIVT